MTPPTAPLLQVDGLSVEYVLPATRAFGHKRVMRAVDEVSFSVARGTSFGIVGESGSGKSTTAAAIMRLVAIASGRILFDGERLDALGGEALRRFRRRLQIVLQDPYSSLNPRARVAEIIREPLDIQEIGTRGERRARTDELLALVGLRPEAGRAFPHQFSGGQRQRIGIARALATNPELVVCDEPVSALDVAIQAQVLNLLKRLQRERGLTFVFISHDLGVVHYMCDQVGVMYLGRLVEIAPAKRLFSRPLHPYTKALLAARPSIHARDRVSKAAGAIAIGDPPSPTEIRSGCRFAGRCSAAQAICRREAPLLEPKDEQHEVACHFATP
ncbi:MAG: ABC transporter ATP-binding protein [Proteobacteria bacterium]|nr:ABC transporter ATP-binding protein [Pseudomonadota bacterium]